MPMAKHALIDLIEQTDPYCTWCWGSEPILRRVLEAYGDQVRLSFVMGGLTDDSESVQESANGIGGSDWERQVAAHWLDASSRHGMPVDVSRFVEKVAPRSTYRANIGYEAAKLQDPRAADRHLRRLREAAATESRSIHLPEIQADMAEKIGLNRERFLADLAGPAKMAFEADRRACRERDVHGFPTFLLRSDGREWLMRGYQRFEAFAVALDSVAGQPLETREPMMSDDAVLAFVEKYGSAATREMGEVFAAADAAVDAALRRLAAAGLLEARPAGTGKLHRFAKMERVMLMADGSLDSL